MENLLIISIKSVILTKSKNNNPSQMHKYWAFGTFLEKRKGVKYMKATGIVRRIEEYGIIGQKLSKCA